MENTMNRGIWERLSSWWRQLRGQPAPRVVEEPVLVVQQGLRWLRLLSMAGVTVDEALRGAVFEANRQVAAQGRLTDAATASRLYDAIRDLAILAIRLDDERDVPLADCFLRSVANSELLLKHAAEAGTVIADDTMAKLIAGQAALGGPPTAAVKRDFYVAYTALAKQLGEVTADTIKACRAAYTKATLKRNRRCAVGCTLVAVVFSVGLFVADKINADIKEQTAIANDLAIRLRGTVFPPAAGDSSTAPIEQRYVEDPCKEVREAPGAQDFKVRSQTDLEQIQRLAIAIRDVHSLANRLNWFVLWTECNPFGYCLWDWEHTIPPAEFTRDRLELRPAILNFTAEFLCKVQAWQQVRDFALHTQRTYEAGSGGVVGHALPILYALLGAYAYRLRQFGETTRNRTYHPSYSDSARLITAVIGGAVAGMFNPIRDQSVSPLATAFLVGYGVEIFFQFLDSLLKSFGARSPGKSEDSRKDGKVAEGDGKGATG